MTALQMSGAGEAAPARSIGSRLDDGIVDHWTEEGGLLPFSLLCSPIHPIEV